ncbi:asparagine synthase (glutamine-hydrolyzing) [Planctomycetaceae bacterium SH139]
MCGIAGFYRTSPSEDPDHILSGMLTAIFHRGPDEEGRLHDGELSMGMRRLSIIALSDGSQPISNETGRYTVVFNGEIYNYRELRKELLQRGHQLKTESDTEVIVHLYEELGAAALERLRGMFAFAIWDREKRELFIARDRLGVKPLYYSQTGETFVFGSEIKAILAHPRVTAAMNLTGLSQYLSLKYVPAPQTLFENIHSLPPGHYIKLTASGSEINRYWDLSYPASVSQAGPPQFSEEEYTNLLLEKLRDAVRIRLRSDVPFGAFLSGGLDSSIIVALMAEMLDEPVNTFSVGFGGDGLADELPYAQQVADRFGCHHHTLKITAADFLKHAEDVIWHLDQPIADQATVATHMVAKLARKHVKMVLTGEGGDELFAGYARYAGEQFSRYFSQLPAPLGNMIRAATGQLPGLRRAKIAIGALTRKDEATRFANWFPMFSDDAKQTLLDNQSLALQAGATDLFASHLERCQAKTPLNRMLYVDSKLWLPDYLLLRGDKLTMANSLEARVPLLDHHLVEFAARVPEQYKLRGRTRKYLLKQVARKLLPVEIIDRKKQGFPIPIEHWLRKEANPLMRDLLCSSQFHQRGLFNKAFVERLMREHETGFQDHATELWGLMSVEIWSRRFID